MSPTDPWTQAPRRAPGAWSASQGLRWQAIDAIACRAPRIGLHLAGALAAAAHRAGWLGPRPDRLGPLLPSRDASARRAVARAVASRAAMTRCLTRLVESGHRGALEAVVAPQACAEARAASAAGPAVLVSFHAGVWPALGYLMDAAERPVLIVEQDGTPVTGDPGRSDRVRVDAGPQSRARALKCAVERLRGGAAVLLLADERGGIDGPHGGAVLGRPLAVGRGPGWLAARTGARVVPLVARWGGRRPEVVLRTGAPVAVPQEEVAGRLAGWLDLHLREHPEDLSVELVERLSAAGGET